jgi:O-antigen/teichoic acid export membrane protein
MPNKYLKNYVLSVTNTVMGLIIPIITFPYISRILGPDKIGVVNFVKSYAYYFMHIASFGIMSYAVREIARVRDNKSEVERLGNEIFNINVFFSFISGLIYLAIVCIVPKFRENFLLYLIYSSTIFTNFLLLDWLFQAYDDYAFSTLRSIIVRVLSIAAIFIFIKQESDYSIYMIIISIAEMGNRFSSLFYARKKFINFKLSFKFLNFAKHFKSLFTLFSYRIVNGVSSNLDKLMLGLFIAYKDVGIYSTGVKFILLVVPVIETVGVVLFPKITISAKDNLDIYLENLNLNYRIILLLAIPMTVGMFLVSPELMLLFAGKQFTGSILVSRIMCIIILLCPVGDLLGSKTLLIYNKDKWLLICSIIVAISNIVFNFIGIPLYGITGACAASVLCYLIAVTARYIFTKRIIKFTLFIPELFCYTLYTLPFIVLYRLFKNHITNSIPILFVYIFSCMLIYFLELILFKDKTTKHILSKLIMRKTNEQNKKTN